ncbi:PREDICTED: polyadenylate-binding protein-interacting protein 5-like [Tarenaya hassleriana]|uniref:polyadenylate-binding protein-interacting protein 5-like n=1 Tax=Tarenaya hassleriana TaxID=28532 RepID=UPI00053C789D|nr:PREDICTED: polyadenylate-binding protein-interacting protein 5-like [Tarenaya hassleriana]XP_010541638.1 PREDICTED: polyadenylate-binding protein-interacting protein 5-like [Tarenaya hassleriana]XP_010541639.1 PREDICTED: polyadenylate-binding protein-interacting protein 5-like [Tarenaya hassleriana]
MKPGVLNPYAASYIPLSKREGYAGDGELFYTQRPMHIAPQSQQIHVSRDYGEAQGVKSYPGSEVSVPKQSSDMTHKQMRDEDLEMDMDVEFLLMIFPGLSHESIADVYLANNGDIEAAMDMLTQLETYSSEPESLPDTLDFESGPSTWTVPKPKNAATEATAASSGTHP